MRLFTKRLLFVFPLLLALPCWSQFNFSYAGPDTIYVGNTCTAPLNWGNPLTNPTITCTSPGCVITSRNYQVSGGFLYNDPVPGNTVVLVTYTVNDNFGNTQDFGFIIRFADTTKPVFVAGTMPRDTIILDPCAVPLPPALSTIQAVDNCPPPGNTGTGVTVTYLGESPRPSTCVNGSFTRTWRATDVAGNFRDYRQTIQVRDDELPPAFVAPRDTVILCSEGVHPNVTGWPTQISDCSGVRDTSFSDVLVAGACAQEKTLERTWRLRDRCANSITFLQKISIIDTVGPVFIRIPRDTVFQCSADYQTKFRQWWQGRGRAIAVDACTDTASLKWFAAVPGSYKLNDASTWPGTSPDTLDVGVCPSTTPGLFRQERVDFVVYDPCGNAAVRTAVFRVQDTIAPVFTFCPGPQMIGTDTDSCSAGVVLPVPVVVDACTNAGMRLSYQIDAQPVVSVGNYSALNVRFNVGTHTVAWMATDCAGNMERCIAQFTVTDDEVPTVVCPPNSIAPIQATDDCAGGTVVTLPLPVTVDDNCTPTNSLMYGWYVTLPGGSTTTLQPASSPPSTPLPPGISTIHWEVRDAAGNSGQCQFTINVLDTIRPVARCRNAVVSTEPSGLDPATITPDLINNGSTDNCSIAQFQVVPQQFYCNQAGVRTVRLIVTDVSGNTATCDALVTVQVLAPNPTYVAGICGNELLQLFANPPFNTSGADVFTYQWTGPQGFQSNDRDPSIPSANSGNSGLYKLVISGPTGCTSQRTIQVDVSDGVGRPPLQVSASRVCTGDAIILTTQSYSGALVRYFWYEGIPGSGLLLGSTSDPVFTINPPLNPGIRSFYLRVVVDLCVSEFSIPAGVEVVRPPVATVVSSSITVCEGDPIQLGTLVTGSGISYQWTGPDGFSSVLAQPPAFAAALPKAGVYTLVLTLNGCASAPASTTVVVRRRPAKPAIAAGVSVCAGRSFQLTATPGNSSYTWFAPNFTQQTTSSQVLSISGATALMAGDWRVQVILNGCVSELSNSVTVVVHPTPGLSISGNSPLCTGDTLRLQSNTGMAAQLRWSGPNGFLSSAQNPVLVPVSGGVYQCIATNSFGCADTSQVNITVNVRPRVNAISHTGGNCMTGTGQVQFFSLLSPPDPGSYVYQWTGPGNFSSNLSNPVLPNATAANSGDYRLVVVNAQNCPSPVLTYTLNLVDRPARPVLPASISYCEGDEVVLEIPPYTGTMVTYQWITPQNTVVTSDPKLVLQKVLASQAGNYRLRVLVDGCASDTSSALQLIITPGLATPTVTSNGPLCEGTDLVLNTPVVAGAQYLWSGPGGFTASTPQVVIPNATAADKGIYQVRLIQGTCTSPVSDPVNVVINAAPRAPVIQSVNAVCRDDVSQRTALFKLVDSTASAGATYMWYDASTQDPVGGPTASTSFNFNMIGYGAGEQQFYVVAMAAGCASSSSVPVSVQVDTIPAIKSNAGMDLRVCEDQIVFLNAVQPLQGSGLWEQVTGNTILPENNAQFNSKLGPFLLSGLYAYSWQLSNGGCKLYSRDTVQVVVDDNDLPVNAGSDQVLCQETETLLSATLTIGTTGMWSQPVTQDAVFQNATQPGTRVSNLKTGNYKFIWSISNTGCGQFASDTAQVVVTSGSITANAGTDQQTCGDGSVILKASEALNRPGFWTPLQSGVVVQPNDQPEAVAAGLQTGLYGFVWAVDNGPCGLSRDTVYVQYQLPVVAVDDQYDLEFASITMLDVASNDQSVPARYILRITLPPDNGVARLSNGQIEFQAFANYVGEDVLEYEICNAVCPLSCTRAKVFMNIGENTGCDVPSIFTPNGDGMNDFFIVPCLATTAYPQAHLVIFNQWGAEVYRSDAYRNDWEGTHLGKPLPTGTYYYLLDLKDGKSPKSGYVIIER